MRHRSITLNHLRWLAALAATLTPPAFAATSSTSPVRNNEPVEVSADTLDVHQNEHQAIFTGNVIAVQGTTKMRAKQMVVFYREQPNKAGTEKSAKAPKPAKLAKTAPAPAPAATPPATTPPVDTTEMPPVEGIYRIEATGDVVFTTPTETAMGDTGIYDVDANSIDLTGGNVTLTRGQNVLKGTHVIYNMTTGRSTLTGGAKGQPARVHGLFVPKAAEEKK